jgi:hypothetical protein
MSVVNETRDVASLNLDELGAAIVSYSERAMMGIIILLGIPEISTLEFPFNMAMAQCLSDGPLDFLRLK